jgi:hypothetical protein
VINHWLDTEVGDAEAKFRSRLMGYDWVRFNRGLTTMDADDMSEEALARLNREMAWCFEKAEVCYLKAKQNGFIDPVVVFQDIDPHSDAAGTVTLRLHCVENGVTLMNLWCAEREDTARHYEKLPELAAMIRTPRLGYPMTVLIASNGGMTVHDCMPPQAE